MTSVGRFDKEFIFMGVRRLSGVAITIPAAIILRDQWALVAGTVISAAVGLVLSYVMLPYRPRLTLILKGELLGKANWLMASNFIMFVRGRASDFVLGRINGPATVGAYNLAAELSAIVSTELVAPVNRVALSDFSLQGTREPVVWRLDQLTGLLAIVLMPLGVGLSIHRQLDGTHPRQRKRPGFYSGPPQIFIREKLRRPSSFTTGYRPSKPRRSPPSDQ